MKLRIGGRRAREYDCPGAGFDIIGNPDQPEASVSIELVSPPDPENRGRPRLKARLTITRAELVDDTDPLLPAVVRHLVLMLESAGIDWRANRYLETPIDCEGCPGEGCPRCHGGSLR